MGTVINVRRQKLDMLERGASSEVSEDHGDETKFFRVATKTEQRVTARPPASDVAASPAPLSAPNSARMAAEPVGTSQAFPIVQEQADEPTMLFRRNEDGSARRNLFGGAPEVAESEGVAQEVRSDPPLTPSLFQSAVHKRQSLAAIAARDSQIDLEPQAEPPAPASAPRRSQGPLVLGLVAVVVLLGGLRLGWLMHRDHVSLSAAWHEQARALGLK